MPRYRFETVDVFTDRRFGGNPLAVFPEAQGLSSTEMQQLALKLNLSETNFVLPPENPACSARAFASSTGPQRWHSPAIPQSARHAYLRNSTSPYPGSFALKCRPALLSSS